VPSERNTKFTSFPFSFSAPVFNSILAVSVNYNQAKQITKAYIITAAELRLVQPVFVKLLRADHFATNCR
jgi:hypothetical protein